MEAHPRSREGLRVFEAEDGYVVYDKERDRVHFLNHTAALVLELCNGRHGRAELAEIVGKAYGLAGPPHEEVTALLERFGEEGMVL